MGEWSLELGVHHACEVAVQALVARDEFVGEGQTRHQPALLKPKLFGLGLGLGEGEDQTRHQPSLLQPKLLVLGLGLGLGEGEGQTRHQPALLKSKLLALGVRVRGRGRSDQASSRAS